MTSLWRACLLSARALRLADGTMRFTSPWWPEVNWPATKKVKGKKKVNQIKTQNQNLKKGTIVEDFIDVPKPLRSSDSFDREAVNEWVKESVPSLSDLSGFQRSFNTEGELEPHLSSKVQRKRNYLKKRPRGHKAKSAHDMGREYKVMKALKTQYPYVPEMIAFCDNEELIGGHFYLMERMKGVIPRKDFPKGMEVGEDRARKLCFGLFDRLIELHQVDIKKAALFRPWERTRVCEEASGGLD